MVERNNSVTTFSIITPCLNAAGTIEKTIQSVLNQKGDTGPLEHIVIDGMSTDGTLDIVEEYVDRYSHITSVSELDSGIYDAMNKGIALAKGDYIGIINADDWYDEMAMCSARQVLDSRADVGLVYGNMGIWKESSMEKIVKPRKSPWARFISMPFLHPTCFVRASVYHDFGAFDPTLRIAGDYDFILRLYDAGVRAEYLDQTIAHFRSGGASSTDFAIRERARVRAKHGLPIVLSYLIVLLVDANRLFRR